MPTYVTLVNFTEDGREDIDELPKRIEKIKELKRSLGGEPLGFFLTMGQYDMGTFSEMPDDESVAKVQLTAALEGAVETEILRAFRMEEVTEILDQLPRSE
jgi:uncharacterized protein with GYD domain